MISIDSSINTQFSLLDQPEQSSLVANAKTSLAANFLAKCDKNQSCNFATIKISWVSENELQEEDHLDKQLFVPKAILQW